MHPKQLHFHNYKLTMIHSSLLIILTLLLCIWFTNYICLHNVIYIMFMQMLYGVVFSIVLKICSYINKVTVEI